MNLIDKINIPKNELSAIIINNLESGNVRRYYNSPIKLGMEYLNGYRCGLFVHGINFKYYMERTINGNIKARNIF